MLYARWNRCFVQLAIHHDLENMVHEIQAINFNLDSISFLDLHTLVTIIHRHQAVYILLRCQLLVW